ncbi:hypothetical protein BKG96_03200 [Rodentibacter caecimuris]|uniref:Probable membrane transporter protein n=1 Tax=Rodentibacter caecimuris TaxID=1796644 RepID=A0A1V3KPR2_9PAST|nr:sulfite exporter TauE/SafE family protein [Rodentibacter heylii]OOF79328.1 hypothetical protein BKG96_03200 [Rodentibacter heylii]
MSLQLISILVLCGFFTNLMSAVFGIGGGVLMVPILYTLFPDFPLQMIAATSLTIVIGSSIINLIYFYQQKIQISIKAVLFWSLSTIIGVQSGFEISFFLPDILIISIFVGTLSLLALKIMFSSESLPHHGQAPNEICKGSGLCLFGGLIAGLTGIGGGSIMAPLIGQLKSIKPQQIAPYTNYMMVIGGSGSLYSYLTKSPPFYLTGSWQVGYVNFSIVAIVVLSAFMMSFFSMKIRGKLSPSLTRKLLALILFIIAGYMLVLHLLKG